MRLTNKKIKLLNTLLGSAIIYSPMAFCAISNVTPNAIVENKVDLNDNTAVNGSVPTQYLDISGTTLMGFTTSFNRTLSVQYGTLEIPASITSISSRAFYNNSGTWLSSTTAMDITFQTGSLLQSIGSEAFMNMSCFKSIDFSTCTNLQTIGVCAFTQCSGLTGTIDLSKTQLTKISQRCFNSCKSIVSAILPSSIDSLDSFCFCSCNNMCTVVFIGTSVTTISASAFAFNTSLQSINLSNLTELEQIGASAFFSCGSLSDQTLYLSTLSNLTSIGVSAFFGAPDTCFDITTTTAEGLGVYYDKTDTICFGNYTSDQTAVSGDFKLKTTTRLIASSAFSGCNSIRKVNFSGCTNLEYIGDFAFQGCTNATGRLDLSQCTKLSKILSNTFINCNGLEQLNLPSSITEIGSFAFANCGFIDKNVEGSYRDAIDLKECTELTTIGDNAFSRCSYAGTVRLPSSIISIGTNTFYSCTGISTLDLSRCNSLKNVGTHAFLNVNVATVLLGWSKDSLYDGAFTVTGGGNLPILKEGGKIYIPEGTTKNIYINQIPDLPVSYKNTNNWSDGGYSPSVDPDDPDNTGGLSMSANIVLYILIGASAALIILIIIVGCSLNGKIKRLDEQKKDKFPTPRGGGPRGGGYGRGPGRYY